jgi:preprotein translocase subunit SecG
MASVFIHYVVPAIHVLSCIFLIVVVLLQTGKGADMGAVFGGGSQTLFGSGGAGNLLTKLTTGTAIAFMLTSLILTYGQSRTPSSSLINRLPAPAAEAPAPVTPPPADVPPADATAPAPNAAADAPPVAANDAAPAADAPAPAAQAPAPAANAPAPAADAPAQPPAQ